MWNAAASIPANYNHGTPFVTSNSQLGDLTHNARQYARYNSNLNVPLVRNPRRPGVGVTSAPIVTTSTPVITGGALTPNLATMRQEVRADKMAVKNDLATGNNARLRQDEMRLQSDEQMERATSPARLRHGEFG